MSKFSEQGAEPRAFADGEHPAVLTRVEVRSWNLRGLNLEDVCRTSDATKEEAAQRQKPRGSAEIERATDEEEWQAAHRRELEARRRARTRRVRVLPDSLLREDPIIANTTGCAVRLLLKQLSRLERVSGVTPELAKLAQELRAAVDAYLGPLNP